MKKILRRFIKVFIYLTLLALAAGICGFVYLQSIFGDTPSKQDVATYQQLPYFENGQFKSPEPITYHFDKVQGGTLSVFKFLKKSPYAPRFELPKIELTRDSFPKCPITLRFIGSAIRPRLWI